MHATPPSEFIEIGLDALTFNKFGGHEWHGKCPFCGGNDRFTIYTDRCYPSWNSWCRVCGWNGWIDEINPRLKEQQQRMTPQERAQRAAEQAKQAEDRLAAEIQRAEIILKELRESRAWLRYHEQLTDQARQIWDSWGIPEYFQEFWKLGYESNRTVWAGNLEWHTPTMTIPIFEAGTWECQNIRHRLMNPPRPGDKYRPERAGLPAQFFVTNPDDKIAGATFIVEGEKKAMVSYITADDPHLQILGTPGKNISPILIENLKECEPIYICLDPDATEDARKLCALLGCERTRLITLPMKIDDAILVGALDKGSMRNLMRMAK